MYVTAWPKNKQHMIVALCGCQCSNNGQTQDFASYTVTTVQGQHDMQMMQASMLSTLCTLPICTTAVTVCYVNSLLLCL